ncbi:hypothetical protein GOODEAATRI_032166 [Goodea atripinnis]|uniref:Uncharacterized protein n=1 Tax=Goodea atripinnis TaxID=208336 RepID=A0ABV0PTE8_9TELE
MKTQKYKSSASLIFAQKLKNVRKKIFFWNSLDHFLWCACQLMRSHINLWDFKEHAKNDFLFILFSKQIIVQVLIKFCSITTFELKNSSARSLRECVLGNSLF